MNKKETIIKRMQTHKKYHLNGNPTLKCRVNVVYLHKNNTLLHELWKTKLAHMLRKEGMNYITEACIGKKRVDLVCLDTGEEFEIIAENDSPEIRQKYKEQGVTVVEASWIGLQQL